MRAQKAEIGKIAGLDFRSLDLESLRGKLELLGLSESAGLLKVTVIDLPQLAVTCPSLFRSSPAELRSAFEVIFGKKHYKKAIEGIVSSKNATAAVVTSDTLTVTVDLCTGIAVGLILEISFAYIAFCAKLCFDFIMAVAAAVPTGGLSVPAVLLIAIKDMAVFACAMIGIIIGYFIERKLADC